MDSYLVEILLATYNGAEFLEKQLDSIFSQSYPNRKLLIRDDGSQDTTKEIIEKYLKKYPGKIYMIQDSKGNLGVCQNFSTLTSHSNAKYSMFCDQDDIWIPTKIELTMQKMQELESVYGTHTPLLIHTDLKVVNEKLETISESFWSYQKLNPNLNSLNRLLIQNNITGCTVMFNQALRNMAFPIPSEAVIHDWWLALVASAFGKIGFVRVPTVLYRQHSRNEIGAKKYDLSYIGNRVRNFYDVSGFKNSLYQAILQAKCILKLYGVSLDRKKREMLENFIRLYSVSWIERQRIIFRYKIWKYGFLRNLGLMLRI